MVAGGVVGAGLSRVTGKTAASPEVTGALVSELRQKGSGFSKDEIEDLQASALEQYRALTGDEEMKIIGTPNVWSDDLATDLEIVSYALKMFPDGTSEYHAGVIEKDQPDHIVSEAHHATEKFLNFVAGAETRNRNENKMTTQSGDANYEYVAGGSTSNPGCPEGTLSITSDLYEWVNSNSNRTIFATQADFQAIPGVNRDQCNGVWYNGYTDTAAHKWDMSDLTGGNQTDHKPAGAKTGSSSSTFTISNTGASLSWSYDEPNVEREDNSSEDRADWFYDYNSQAAAGSTCVWETGSEAEFNEFQDPSYGDLLYQGFFKHRFFDKFNYGRKMKEVAYDYKYGQG